jgi:hypothetical protein
MAKIVPRAVSGEVKYELTSVEGLHASMSNLDQISYVPTSKQRIADFSMASFSRIGNPDQMTSSGSMGGMKRVK